MTMRATLGARWALVAVAIGACLPLGASAAKHSYTAGDKVKLWANVVGPFSNPRCGTACARPCEEPALHPARSAGAGFLHIKMDLLALERLRRARGPCAAISAARFTLSAGRQPRVWPWRGSVTYQYYERLPFCQPADGLVHKPATLGELVDGNRLVLTPYDIVFREDRERVTLCTKQLTRREVQQFQAVRAWRRWRWARRCQRTRTTPPTAARRGRAGGLGRLLLPDGARRQPADVGLCGQAGEDCAGGPGRGRKAQVRRRRAAPAPRTRPGRADQPRRARRAGCRSSRTCTLTSRTTRTA